MLHHVATVEQQDAVLVEICRLLQPGGVLAGEDSLDSPELRDIHHDDTYVPVGPTGLSARLDAAGFVDVAVDTNEHALRFRARKPTPSTAI
jgi:ubiquinone/menaquinone biosynthesis C-methylase UbiE